MALAAGGALAATAGDLPKLNVSFWIWGLYGMQEGGLFRDLDSRMVELKSRGFNCIRLDDAAGFYRTPDGRPRGKITFRKPDRTYTADMGGYSFMSRGEPFDPAENLVRFVKACDRHGVKVILSSWYYLHTNWFVDDAFNRELFEGLPYERKYDYFADELSHAIGILRKHGLEHCIAYAEIFNEANALPFTHPGVPGQGTSEYMARDRELHEKAIAKLKKANPNVRFAYDFTGPGWIWKELVPRNADVIAFHDYYFWDIYGKAFEHGSVKDSAEEVPIAPEAMRFLRNPPVSFEEVKASRKGNLRTGNDWLSRVRLYASIDGRKVPELEAEIEKRFAQDEADYKAQFAKDVALVVKTRDELFPKADLVFAEGVSCCPNGRILFEQLSRRYWNMLLWQAELLRKSGVRGAIPRTNSGPEDPAWLMNSADLRAVNEAFAR